MIGVTINDDDMAFYIDQSTHLLSRIENVGHWRHKGDRLEWRSFQSYENRNGAMIPLECTAHIENGSTQITIETRITSFTVDGRVTREKLTIPEAHLAGFEDFAVQAPEMASERLLPVHDLGNGLYIVDLVPSDARSLLVEFEDYAMIIEAGDFSDVSERLLETAEALLPAKPVRYVAMTHHHPLYANGIRPFVRRGVTIFDTEGNLEYMRDLATRPYRIKPDRQQLERSEPIFEIVSGKRVIEDETQRVELHEFDYSTHTDEFILPYVARHKLVITGDLVRFAKSGELSPAGSRAKSLERVISERELDVETIVQTWYLQDGLQRAPLKTLVEMIEMAEEE